MSDKPRILVVDDEVGVREALRVILRPKSDLVTVESGEAALQALSTFHPDVVFLDIKMPAPDGLEVLQRIKAHDRTIEVVMVTAYASFETLRKSLTDGAFEYLIKPFSRHQVEETVRRALARRTGERGAAGQQEASGRVSVGLVGGGKGGSALLDLLLEWVPGKVAVVVDPRPDAPALSKARTLGIPTAEHHREVFGYPVDLVLEATGQPAVLDDLVRTKPPGVEVIGSGSLRLFWDLLQTKVTATRQLRAQLDMAVALESTLDLNQQVVILTRKLAQACGVDRCSFFLRDEATGLVIPVMAQFATGESNERMWNAFQDLGRLKLVEIPFLYEAMERQGPIAINDPASNPLVPPGWRDLFEFKSLLVVPIFRKNRVVGACVLDYCREARRFTPDQTVLASALASQITLALENARLYQDVVEKADRLASLLEATKRTVAIKDSQQLLPWIAQEAATCLKAEGAGIRILEGEELVYAGHYGYSRDGMRDRIGLGESGTGWVVRHNQPLAIPDIERDPRMVSEHRAAYRREGFHSMLAVPMRVAERAIGALFVFTKSLRQFSATEVEILSGFADQAALAVENLLLYEETERRRWEAEVLAELVRNVNASLHLDTVLQRVTEGAQDLCRSDLAQIALRDPGSEALVVRYVVGTRYKGYDDIRIEAGKGLGGRVLLTGRPIRTHDYAKDPRLTNDYLQVIREEGIVAEMVVPIRIEDRIEGLLYVANRSPRPFTDRDEAILLRLAAPAAIAMQNARLYAEASRSAAEHQALFEVAGLVGSTLNVDRVLDVIVERACALLRVRAAGIFKVDPQSDVLVYERDRGLSREFIDSLRILVGEGTSGKALQHRAPAWSFDLLNDPAVALSEQTRDLVRREGYRAVLSVPILIKDTPYGVLAVYWWEPHAPALSEVRLLSALAGQAAVALENARLFEEAQRRRMTAERLAEVGHLLSQSLDVTEVGQRIVDSIRGLLGVRSAFLFRVEQEAGDWTVIATSGEVGPGFQRGMVYPREVGATGLALRERRSVVTTDVFNDPRITFTPEVRAHVEQAGYRAVLALPLLIQDRAIGALSVGDQTGRGFTEEEIQLAQAFASQAATALENSRLYGELRQALEELEASQQQIVQTERLRALGEMAGGVAHDFNNMLSVILGRAQLLLSETQDPEVRRKLEVIAKVALDGAQTVRRIQEFTRIRRARPVQALDLNRVIGEVVEVTRARWRDEAQASGIPYDVQVETTPVPLVIGDASELREALTNILFNALDAMPKGGRVTFQTGVQGEHVSCVVTDTGVGMPQEVRQRIFEPFFTTKGEKGTGLGLSVAYGIIARHGGEIEVQSHVGRGSAFTICLPVAREIPEPPEAVPLPRPVRSAKILIIDDEEEVRDVLGDLLNSEGHAVTACADGQSGLARFDEEAFDLVFTDLAMPGLTGWQVANLVKLRNPATPVALVTGFRDRISFEEARTKGVDFLVAKPFELEELMAVVAEALTREGVKPG
jgi:GAF domain-containing protein/DNA-binding response OmpR family regulator